MIRVVLILCIMLLMLQIFSMYKTPREPYCLVDGDCKVGQKCQKSSFGTGDGFCV